MTERYAITDSTVYIELFDKDPEAVKNYEVDFAQLIADGFELTGTPVVEIEMAGNGESPLEMESQDVSRVAPPGATGSPPLTTAVSFWLSGGTDGVRYRGKIRCDVDGDESPALGVLVKRFYIVTRLT